jgi:hypothetical protein
MIEIIGLIGPPVRPPDALLPFDPAVKQAVVPPRLGIRTSAGG